MKLKIHSAVIIRVPQFPLDAELIEEWEQLKLSIKLSSKDFYETIQDVPAEQVQNLPRQVYHTIWKYFNRAKYRATPYGSFAAFGVIHKSHHNRSNNVRIDNDQVLHKFICWTETKKYSGNISLTPATILFANSSYYRIHEQVRYLVQTEDGAFELAEVEAEPLLMEILKQCQYPISVGDLVFKYEGMNQAMHLIEEMVKLQLLFTDARQNIIGDDYFKRVGIKNTPGLPQYIMAERAVESGYPNLRVLQRLPALISLMNSLIKPYHSADLENFKSRFGAKFEDRLIPLMVALDPELGVSYTGNEESSADNSFINLFNRTRKTSKATNSKILEHLLLKARNETTKEPIYLESFEDDFEQEPVRLANTFGILCSVVDEQVIIEHIGGATATALLGRYSLASDTTTEMCRKLAEIEQNANPDILFFDIAYTSEITTDNINRRQQIYPLQLSILNFDISGAPLTMDDLHLKLNGEELILYSKKLNKRMIPRLTTAYNYTRSDLALFRFLCELQYQGLKPSLIIDVPGLIPNLSFYPRLQYHNIILTPAKWKVSDLGLKTHLELSKESSVRSYLNGLGMDGYVLVRTEDRTLCFNTGDDGDMHELKHIIIKFKSFYLEEGFIPKQAIVTDQRERSYAHQFLFSVYHDQRVYDGLSILPDEHISDERQKQIFPAGSEWLYYEIHIHPLRSDYLLQNKISEFLKSHQKRIRCWFFIRFNEGGDHIRLRMKLKNIKDMGLLMVDLAELLETEIESGIISDFKINSYKRELERYSPQLIQETEEHFFKDSQYVVNLLKKSLPDTDKYYLCFDLLFSIRKVGIIEQDIFDEMINSISNSFLLEHQTGKEDYKRLNQEYKVFKAYQRFTLVPALSKKMKEFEDSFKNLLLLCSDERRSKLMIDLIHMHVNRLFPVHQRTHEMVIYYFAVKELQYRNAFRRKTGVEVA